MKKNSYIPPDQANDRLYNSDNFDFNRILSIIAIHKWLFMFILAIVMLLAGYVAWHQREDYSAQFEVFYNESINEYASESNVPVVKTEFDRNLWLSIMKSDQMISIMLKNAQLPFSPDMLRSMFKVSMLDKTESTTPIFLVTIKAPQPTLIPVIINSFVESINELLTREQAANSKKIVSFLSKQLADNNSKLAEIDFQLVQSGPGAVRDSKKMSEDLESLRMDLVNTQINLSSLRASKIKTEQELKNMDGTIVNESAFSEPLKVQLMNLQVDLARALTKNKEDHPVVRAIRDNIKQVNNLLLDSIQQKMEIKSLIQNPLKRELMSKLVELAIQEQSLDTRRASLERVIAEMELKMRGDASSEQQQQLYRNREQVAATVNIVSGKIIESQMSGQVSLSRFLLIDEPTGAVSATKRSPYIILLIGFFLALLIASSIVLIYDMLDDRINLVSDYRKLYNIPILGAVLHKKRNPDIESDLREFSEISLHIKQILKDPSKKLFSICSPHRREGKTSICITVAKSLADKGMSVLLVDMDALIPMLTSKMGAIGKEGLLNLIYEDINIDRAIHSTNQENLFLTGIGSIKVDKRLHYESPIFDQFLEQVRNQYDIVIFDTPAVLSVPDVASFIDKMDAIIIVVRLMVTTRKALDKMLEMTLPSQSIIVGTILNGLRKGISSSSYYYYGYEYADESKKD